jgi:hypothetical protein
MVAPQPFEHEGLIGEQRPEPVGRAVGRQLPANDGGGYLALDPDPAFGGPDLGG